MMYQLVATGKDDETQLEGELKLLQAQLRVGNNLKDDTEEKFGGEDYGIE